MVKPPTKSPAKTPDIPPPYLNLDPARAAARLGPPVDTQRFAKAAAFCNQGREDLAKRGYAPDGKKHLRRLTNAHIANITLGHKAAQINILLQIEH